MTREGRHLPNDNATNVLLSRPTSILSPPGPTFLFVHTCLRSSGMLHACPSLFLFSIRTYRASIGRVDGSGTYDSKARCKCLHDVNTLIGWFDHFTMVTCFRYRSLHTFASYDGKPARVVLFRRLGTSCTGPQALSYPGSTLVLVP
jgi:hypothetical protein